MWLEKLKIEGKFQEKPQIRGYCYFETRKVYFHDSFHLVYLHGGWEK